MIEQKSVYDGEYDAMGFFFHLKAQGADVYSAMRFALTIASNQEAMLAIRGVASDRAFSLWPTGLARLPSLGSIWDGRGPAITSASRAIGEEFAQEGAAVEAVADAGEQRLFDLYFPDGQVLILSNFSYGGIAWAPGPAGAETVLFGGSHGGKFCAQDTCRCEDGSWPEGITKVPWSGGDFRRALIALSGSESVGEFYASVEDYECEPVPTSCPTIILNSEEVATIDATECGGWSGPAARCLAGVWRQDTDRYVAQPKELLPNNAVGTQAENTTTISISPDGTAQTCIKFSAEIEFPGSLLFKTKTTAEGASVVKLGAIDAETLRAIPIREEVNAFAVADIGGVTDTKSIVGSGAIGRLSKFTCSAQELIIITPAEHVGDVESKYLRIQ